MDLFSTSIIAITGITYFLICLIGCTIPCAIIIFLYYFVRKQNIEASNEYVKDIFSLLWYRFVLITPKGFFLILTSVAAIALSLQSIEFSVISTMAFFFIFIFVLVYIYSWVFNVYLFYKGHILKQKLISSNINLHVVQAGDYVKKDIE